MSLTKKLALVLLIVFLIFLVFKIINKIKINDGAWKVEITYTYVNVREDHNQYSHAISKAFKGEKYKVLDIYLDDSKYVWYKIDFKGQAYWIASDRENPYVKEYNNPNLKESSDYVLDYKNPVLKFQEEIYYVKDINSINYDHLIVEDDSKFTITHEVFYEKESKDTHVPQYWIRYKAVDEYGNTTVKTQKIVFEKEPKSSEVKDFDTEY